MQVRGLRKALGIDLESTSSLLVCWCDRCYETLTTPIIRIPPYHTQVFGASLGVTMTPSSVVGLGITTDGIVFATLDGALIGTKCNGNACRTRSWSLCIQCM